MVDGGNVYVLQLEADFDATRSTFRLKAPEGRRGKEGIGPPFDARQLARLPASAPWGSRGRRIDLRH